jgi:hypothetical protein
VDGAVEGAVAASSSSSAATTVKHCSAAPPDSDSHDHHTGAIRNEPTQLRAVPTAASPTTARHRPPDGLLLPSLPPEGLPSTRRPGLGHHRSPTPPQTINRAQNPRRRPGPSHLTRRTRTSGSAGGHEKRTRSNPDTAPVPDPTPATRRRSCPTAGRRRSPLVSALRGVLEPHTTSEVRSTSFLRYPEHVGRRTALDGPSLPSARIGC